MATIETKHVEITCDLCSDKIPPRAPYVNAQVYGADFHLHCAEPHLKMMKALGLDDIKLMQRYEEWETAKKYIYLEQ